MSTVADVIARVREQLNDTVDGSLRWSDAELIEYINDGLRKTVSIKPEANVIERLFYPVDEGALQKLPADAVKFIKVAGNSERVVPTVDGDQWLDSLITGGGLDNGDLRQITFDLTSRIYPIEAIEGLEFGGDFLREGANTTFIEDLALGVSMLSGNIREVLISLEPGMDSLELGGSAQAGTMRAALISLEPGMDSLELGGAFVTGQMDTPGLISYTYWEPDSMLMGGSIVSGSMTT